MHVARQNLNNRHSILSLCQTTIAALLVASLVGCFEQPEVTVTAPTPSLPQASNGSIVTSSVGVSATVCSRKAGCVTKRTVKILESEVGSEPGQLHLVSEPDSKQQLESSFELGALRADQIGGNGNGRKLSKHFSDDGKKIEAEREDNGVTWRYETTRDRPHDHRHIVAGKIYRNGELLISMESAWDTVAGVDFVRQRTVSFYTSGHLVVRRVITVDPIAVSKASPRSTVQIDQLAKTANDGEHIGLDTGCPPSTQCICDPEQPGLCLILGPGGGGQAALEVLDHIFFTFNSAIDSFNMWLGNFWANGSASSISGLADVFISTYSAIIEPTVINVVNLFSTVMTSPEMLFAMDELAAWILDNLWVLGIAAM